MDESFFNISIDRLLAGRFFFFGSGPPEVKLNFLWLLQENEFDTPVLKREFLLELAARVLLEISKTRPAAALPADKNTRRLTDGDKRRHVLMK